MQRTRVVLAEMSRILGRIVREAVTGQGDMELVADLPDSATLPSVLRRTPTDVVVVGRELVDNDLELLCGCSGVAVLALAKDGRSAFQYQLHPERIEINNADAELSTHLLLEAIRAAAKRPI